MSKQRLSEVVDGKERISISKVSETVPLLDCDWIESQDTDQKKVFSIPLSSIVALFFHNDSYELYMNVYLLLRMSESLSALIR